MLENETSSSKDRKFLLIFCCKEASKPKWHHLQHFMIITHILSFPQPRNQCFPISSEGIGQIYPEDAIRQDEISKSFVGSKNLNGSMLWAYRSFQLSTDFLCYANIFIGINTQSENCSEIITLYGENSVHMFSFASLLFSCSLLFTYFYSLLPFKNLYLIFFKKNLL